MGNKKIVLRCGAVRRIAPITEYEKDIALFGFCGIGAYLTYDPNDDPVSTDEQIADYRAYRRILQVYHERIHSMRWPYLEKEPGVYRWDFLDRLLNGEKEDGIRVQLALLGTPEWMAKKMYPDRTFVWDWQYSMPEMNEWKRVCADVATRYRDRIHEFEVWNEPSEHSLFWHKGTARDYFDMVKNAWEAVKSVDTNIAIVAQTVWAHQQAFIDELYRLGIGSYIDYPADHRWTEESLAQRMKFLERVGSNRGLQANETKSANYNSVERTEALRKTAAADFMRNTLYGNVNGFIRSYEFPLRFYTERDYGVVNPDGTPKYTFFSCKTLINRTTGARAVRSIPLGRGCESFLYRYMVPERVRENGGEYALFIFNRDLNDAVVHLYTGVPKVKIVDLMDNESMRETPGGMLELTVRHPVMVIGADPEALALADAVRVSPETLDIRPGGELSFSINIAADTIKSGTVNIESPLFTARRLPFTAGKDGALLTVREHCAVNPGVYVMKIRTELETTKGRGFAFREIPVTVSSTSLFENIFGQDPLGTSSGNFDSWGNGKLERSMDGEKNSMRLSFASEGSGGIRTAKPVEIIPGMFYSLRLKAKGEGTLSTHFNYVKTSGQKDALDKGYLREKLSSSGGVFVKSFTAPLDVSACEFNFLLFKTKGFLEINDIALMRSDPRTPLNRVMYQAVSMPCTPVIDGDLSDWPRDGFQVIGSEGLMIKDHRGGDDLSGRFCVSRDSENLYIAVEVRDDIDNAAGADARRMFMDDSVQLSFEIEDKNEDTGKVTFAVGRMQGKAMAYRSAVIPSTDIVPSYTIGQDPEGVRAEVRRTGNRTMYEIAIRQDALEPSFRTDAVKKIAFSLLVNDNDGAGRKGYLEWSSGIGNSLGSYYFGTLFLKK